MRIVKTPSEDNLRMAFLYLIAVIVLRLFMMVVDLRLFMMVVVWLSGLIVGVNLVLSYESAEVPLDVKIIKQKLEGLFR